MALIAAVWCWLLTSLHGVWSFGILRDYLDGGVMPLYPSIPVTYGTFFMYSAMALIATFLLGFIACSAMPTEHHLAALLLAWCVGALLGASSVAFEFQFDFGTTWGRLEALRALFFHPVITPVWFVLGLAGTASLTRPLRR